MRGDENRNIDVPSKVKAFRKDFPASDAAIRTDFQVTTLADAPAVVGHAVVVRVGAVTNSDVVLSEAYATRGLRAPVPGAQGMKDTRDAERAMTGAVGRALFLMGYGEKPDDSVDYEPEDWFKANHWADQDEHDTFRTEVKERIAALADTEQQEAAGKLWRMIHWPVVRGSADIIDVELSKLEAQARA